MRREEEIFGFKPILEKPQLVDNKSIIQYDEVSKQLSVISKYVAMLSKRVDDALALTRVQEEKIKDIENRIETLTARELE